MVHLGEYRLLGATLPYFMTYAFSIIPTAVLILFLKARHYGRPWHYILAGGICSVFSTAWLVLSGYSGSSDSKLDIFVDYWLLMAVGPVAGGLVWIASEAQWPDWPFSKWASRNQKTSSKR